jgi:hypothetical protein
MMHKRMVSALFGMGLIVALGLAPVPHAAARPSADAQSSPMGAALAKASGHWEKIGRTTTNFSQPGLVSGVPGQDVYLHVLWVRPLAPDYADLVRTRVTASGDVSISDTIQSGWDFMWPVPDLVISGVYANLMAIWGGTRTTEPSDPNSNISVAWGPPPNSPDAWTLEPANVSEAQGGSSSSIGADTGSGHGLVFTTYGTTGVFVHHGIDPTTPDFNLQTQLGGCCGYSPDVATTGAGALVAWYSNALNHQGVWVQAVDLDSSAPVGAAVRMPGSTTLFNGVDQSIQQITRTPIAAGNGVDDPHTYVAYPGGYPSSTKMLVWTIGPDGPAAGSVVVGKGVSVHTPAVATDAHGHVWVAWSEGGTGGTRLFARRSDVGGKRWGETVEVALPEDDTGCQTLYEVTPEHPTDGDLDIIATISSGCGAEVDLWHTFIEPGLSLKAQPSKFDGKQQVTFKVVDAGVPVGGAKVTAAGESARTDKHGVAHLVLGPYSQNKVLIAKVTRAGYVGAHLKLRAHR